MAATKHRESRNWRLIFVIPFVSFMLAQLFSFATASEENLINRFDDDAYYYFKIARNFVDSGQMTFDGQTATDGFHPLWMLVLLPIFFLIKDPILVLRVIGVLSTIFAFLAGGLGLHALRRRSLLPFAIGCLFLLTGLYAIGITGMETALVLPLGIGGFLIVQRSILPKSSDPSRGPMVALGACLGLLLLARLDTIWLIGSLLCGLLVLFFPAGLKSWLPAALIPSLVLLLFFGYEFFSFGHFMPVSAAVKSLSERPLVFNTLFWDQLIGLNDPATGNLWPVFGIAGLFCLAFLATLAFGFLFKRITLSAEEMLIPVCVAVGFLLYTGYALFHSTWVLWRWYAYPLIFLGVFAFPAVFESLSRRLKDASPVFGRSLRSITVILTVLCFLQLTIQAVQNGLWSAFPAPAFRYENYRLAVALNDRLPESAVIAMGDRAGSFGYFFDGHVVQLEGLVAEEDLLGAIRRNNLAAYLTTRGVEYILTYWDPPSQEYTRWTLLTPLPGFSIGPRAGIELCRENEVLRYTSVYETYYLWTWPGCP